MFKVYHLEKTKWVNLYSHYSFLCLGEFRGQPIFLFDLFASKCGNMSHTPMSQYSLSLNAISILWKLHAHLGDFLPICFPPTWVTHWLVYGQSIWLLWKPNIGPTRVTGYVLTAEETKLISTHTLKNCEISCSAAIYCIYTAADLDKHFKETFFKVDFPTVMTSIAFWHGGQQCPT